MATTLDTDRFRTHLNRLRLAVFDEAKHPRGIGGRWRGVLLKHPPEVVAKSSAAHEQGAVYRLARHRGDHELASHMRAVMDIESATSAMGGKNQPSTHDEIHNAMSDLRDQALDAGVVKQREKFKRDNRGRVVA